MAQEAGGGLWRAQAALDRMPRDKAYRVLQEAMADPAVMRAAARIQEEERRAGAELRPRFQAFADRYRQAVGSLDHEVLSRICPGKHARWGRACVLDADHDAETGPLHWGLTPDGDPIAWVGSPEDD
ncbi:hypothetical protein ACFVYG_32700 [Streptomyces sp. NPDC058256]|uniref:hypothetical protein n=1 Tax=Streptomyces sp. NPDC058256 TaxID=3346408 RepID=UPI0036E044C8